ncbi:glycosyl transferase family 2 [Crinalium epipsammum PCC 9333]|uniref:cellulose synthase (UDP-forming) n=1 Tax=Crinalium epipsammum PCC 9333 TaxID=1173022 RepID=K9W1U0_9CYAN|nr:glycosyltransferase [Crinalium epipsammum]AFZ13707.1 glycosyl transferase family 2 [Crinalium epipsammum PCC 9333]
MLKAWQVFFILLLTTFILVDVTLLFYNLSNLQTQIYVLFPLVILILTTLILRLIYPDSPPLILKIILTFIVLLIHFRYLWWRITATLILDWYNGYISIAVIVMEVIAIINVTIISFQTLFRTNHSPEADAPVSQRIKQGLYTPTVDVLIPTVNEPTFVLRRTLVGCQSMHYPNKKIWVLDDGNRPEIAKLAQELGCKYLARSQYGNAKAGNLNHGLSVTSGEIVVAFDADFIPLNNFLERTIGFFENPEVSLVVTPQNFYNPDSPELNLGGCILPHEQTVFYTIIQPGRDATNSIICTGTSILMRREHLNKIGGIPTSTIVEDWVTGMLLQSKGYKTIFINELLSVGAAPEHLLSYLVQRIRWAEGTLKVLFNKYNPLFLPGLNLWQRINHLSGILYWIDQGTQTISYIAPILFIIIGMQALNTNLITLIYYWLPAYIAGFILVPWIIGTRTILVSYVYNALQCFAIAKITIKTFLFPKLRNRFIVTPKGITQNHPEIALELMKPIIVLLILNFFSIFIAIWRAYFSNIDTDTLTLSIIWAELNTVILAASLLAGFGGIYSSEERIAPRVKFSQTCEVIILDFPHNQKTFTTTIGDMSEYGISFHTPTDINLQAGQKLKIVFPDEQLNFLAKVRRVGKVTGCRLLVGPLTPKQHQKIIEFIYCRPSHWQQPKVANEKQALRALFITLFKLYPLFKK